MRKLSSEDTGIKYSFWSNLFNKPAIALYYLEDWLEEDTSDEDSVVERNEASFWMSLIEQDFDFLSTQIDRNEGKFEIPYTGIQNLFRAFLSSEKRRKLSSIDPVNINLKSLTESLLSHYLLSKIEFNAARYKNSKRIIFKALELRKSSQYFESDRNNFLLGLLYSLLVEIDLRESDQFSADEWIRKLKNIVKEFDLEALKKRLVYLQLLIYKSKNRNSEAIKLWSIESAKEWGTLTDELIICHLLIIQKSKSEKKAEEFYRELAQNFEFRYVHHFYNLYIEGRISSTESFEILEDVLPYENEDLLSQFKWSQTEKIEFLEFTRNSGRLRSRVSDIVADSFRSDQRPLNLKESVLFQKSNTTWLILLEKIQLDHMRSNGELGQNYFHQIGKFFQLLRMAYRGDEISSNEFIDSVGMFCNWNQTIQLNYSKKDWRKDQMLPGTYLLVCWYLIIIALDLNLTRVNSFYTLSTKHNKLDVEFDFHFDDLSLDQMKYIESNIFNARDQLNYEIEDLMAREDRIKIDFNVVRIKGKSNLQMAT